MDPQRKKFLSKTLQNFPRTLKIARALAEIKGRFRISEALPDEYLVREATGPKTKNIFNRFKVGSEGVPGPRENKKGGLVPYTYVGGAEFLDIKVNREN